MRKIIFFVVPLIVLTIAFLLIVLVLNKDNGRGALQVTSTPGSKVYLDGKLIGTTPLCLCELKQMLRSGDYSIKLDPSDPRFSPFEDKIKITSSVLTVVDRTFAQGGVSSGSIITLSESSEKNPQLLIVSFPNKADVYIDSNLAGTTPLLVKNITASDHEVRISKDGYNEKILKIRTVENYELQGTVFLSVAENPVATSSALEQTTGKKVTILQTPTGFLRVRDNPSISGNEVAEINPGETYEVLDKQTDWIKIKLSDGKSGWISSQYAKEE